VKPATLQDRLKKQPGDAYTLTMYAMDPLLNTEIVLYTKGPDDAFLAKYKNYTEGTVPSDELEAANFTGCFNRRKLGPENLIMKDSKNDKFWRKVIIRHPRETSTTETRAEGLAVLKACFLTKKFSNFPPDTIETFDNTNEHDRHAIDQFLLDKDIVDIIKEHIHSADLTPEFYTSFPELARKLWSGTTFPDYARETLGYP
jgi:hypothetical protein